MSAGLDRLADGVLAVIKAAVTPVIDEVKVQRAELKTMRGQIENIERAKGYPDIEARLRAIEKALGIK